MCYNSLYWGEKMLDRVSIAIIEDEKVQLELLNKYVKKWSSSKGIRVSIENFYNAESFYFKWSMDKRHEILLLDVQMPGKNGIELAKKVRNENSDVKIIFITAVTDYIQAGYDVEAINYLIKPIKEEKLYECLDRALDKISKEEKAILIEAEGEFNKINQKDILYIEAFAHYIEINTLQNKYTTRKSIGTIEKELDKNMFVRCHRSYVVGLRYINSIKSTQLELDNGEIIPVSRRRYQDTNVAFIKYFRD